MEGWRSGADIGHHVALDKKGLLMEERKAREGTVVHAVQRKPFAFFALCALCGSKPSQLTYTCSIDPNLV
jgi:hypothetical protein